MRGPRKIDGTLQLDPENIRIIRCYMIGEGSAKDAVSLDLSTTTYGLYHARKSDKANASTVVAGVALEAWDCDADDDGTDDTEQIIKIQVLGPVTDVAIGASSPTVAIGDKLYPSTDAGGLRTLVTTATTPTADEVQDALDAANTLCVGVATSAEDTVASTASVYLLNPLGL